MGFRQQALFEAVLLNGFLPIDNCRILFLSYLLRDVINDIIKKSDTKLKGTRENG